MFPEAVKPDLREHLRRVRAQHRRDLARGCGAAPLPEAFDRKSPSACRDFCWQFVFPASTLCADPRTGQRVRWHLHESAVARAPAIAAECIDLFGLPPASPDGWSVRPWTTLMAEVGFQVEAQPLEAASIDPPLKRRFPRRTEMRVSISSAALTLAQRAASQLDRSVSDEGRRFRRSIEGAGRDAVLEAWLFVLTKPA